MNEVIKIHKANFNNQEANCINARDLWKFLESRRNFSTCIKKKLERFEKNIDYLCFHKKMEANNATKIEYAC